MSRFVRPPSTPRILEGAFLADVARIKDMFLDLGPRPMRVACVGVAAIASFAFVVAFVAGSRAPQASERLVAPTPLAEPTSEPGPALGLRYEPIRTLPDLLPAQAVAPAPPPTTTAPRRAALARRVTAITPATTSAPRASATPVTKPVPRPTAPAAPQRSRPAPAPQTFDSSADTFDSTG